MNMMPYSNEYDAIPICRTHARSLCVHPNFQATTRATSDKIVACRSLCVHTLMVPPLGIIIGLVTTARKKASVTDEA